MTYKLPFFLCLASLLAIAQPARALPRDLLATASDEAVVLAHVQPPDKTDADATTDHTVILTRRLGKDTRWRRLATISGRVVSVAACNEDAKILLDTGDWMTVWEDGDAFGPPVPNVRFVSLAADHDLLWAVGEPASPGTQPVAESRSGGQIPSSATMPVSATQPATWPRVPALYRFDGVRWSWIMGLPKDLDTTESSALSLAIIDHQPVLATNSGGGGIRVWTGIVEEASTSRPSVDLSAKERWSAAREISAERPVINFDILNAGLPPTLWLTEGGPGDLADVADVHALPDDGAAPADPRSATRAAETIRLFSAAGEKLYEQAYSADGTPSGKRSQLEIDLVGPDSEVQNWLAPTLTVVVTMLLFGATRRGGAPQPPKELAEANLALAPLVPRFAAGAIDALPILISIFYVGRQMALAGITDDMPTNDQMIPFYIGAGIYLAYTIACEQLMGRTLGKWIFGLRIATIEGKKAERGALLLRNVLRLVDLILMWLPLAMILFSPLRQRVGDIAAGTLVVRPAEPATPGA